jgi:hypothetical protein
MVFTLRLSAFARDIQFLVAGQANRGTTGSKQAFSILVERRGMQAEEMWEQKALSKNLFRTE